MPGNLRTSTALYWYLQNLEHFIKSNIKIWRCILDMLFVLFFFSIFKNSKLCSFYFVYFIIFQEYLSPAEKTSNCSTEQLSRLTLTTVQVLQASVVHISSSGPHRSTLLTAIHLCYTFYVKHHNILKLPEPLTVPKVLYHIVAKLSDIKVNIT